LLALGLTVCSVPLSTAQTITGIDVVEYGIYVADRVREVPTPDGLHYTIVNNICHVATMSVIPLKRRISFGMRFRVDGQPRGAQVEVRRVSILPRPQVRRGAPAPVTRTEYPVRPRIGRVAYTGVAINTGAVSSVGPWSLQLWHGEQLLTEKRFEVVPDDGVALPDANDAKCFLVS
jgi:hypothetical protein